MFLDPKLFSSHARTASRSALFREFAEVSHASPHLEFFTLDNTPTGEISCRRVQLEPEQGDSVIVRFVEGDELSRIYVAARSNMEARAKYEASRSASVDAATWYDSILLRRLAEAVDADVLVTERRNTLLANPGPPTRSRFCISSAEAMAAAALVLRHQETWTDTWPQRIGVHRGEWLARRIVVEDKVFSQDRSLVRFASLQSLSAIPHLADRSEAMLQRLSTAITIRDVIAVESMKPPNNEGADRLAAHIEWLCLTISGAYDAFALNVNSLLPRGLGAKATSWTEANWRGEARSQFPDLVDIAEKANIAGLLNLCKRLRDTIHSIAPGSTFYSGPQTDGGVSFVLVPADKVIGFHTSCTSAGGRAEDWGAVTFGEEVLLDPLTFAQKLLDAALSRLRSLIDAFPWGDFPHLAMPPQESPEVAETYSSALDFMYASFGLSR